MIIGFVGSRGSGKSLSMVRQAYNDYLNGRRIVSNMKLNFPHEKLTVEMLLDYANSDKQLKDFTVLIDEVHMVMDARVAASKRNLLISYFLLQTRKRNVDFYYTTQNKSQVDKRLRQQTDIYCSCKSAKWIDIDNVEHIWVKNVLFDVESHKTSSNVYYGNEYFSLYDTNEIIGLT